MTLARGAILTFGLAHFAVSDLTVARSTATAVAALGVPADLRTDAVLLALINVCEGEKRPSEKEKVVSLIVFCDDAMHSDFLNVLCVYHGSCRCCRGSLRIQVCRSR